MPLRIELRIHQPLSRTEPAEPPGLLLLLGHERGHALYLGRVQVGIVLPLHVRAPHFGIVPLVELDLAVHPRQPLERSHRPEDAAAAVEHAHAALLVDVLRRLFVEPHEIQRRPLKLLPALIAGLEPYLRQSAESVAHRDVVDDAVLRRALSAAQHDDLLYAPRRKIFQDLGLRHVALHLLREAHHPPLHVRAVGAVGVFAEGEPYALRRAALRLAGPVAAEHPTVSAGAPVELHLFGMHRSAVVVPQRFARSRRQLALDTEYSLHRLFLVHGAILNVLSAALQTFMTDRKELTFRGLPSAAPHTAARGFCESVLIPDRGFHAATDRRAAAPHTSAAEFSPCKKGNGRKTGVKNASQFLSNCA